MCVMMILSEIIKVKCNKSDEKYVLVDKDRSGLRENTEEVSRKVIKWTQTNEILYIWMAWINSDHQFLSLNFYLKMDSESICSWNCSSQNQFKNWFKDGWSTWIDLWFKSKMNC